MVAITPDTKTRDVQIALIGENTKVFRSRTWIRLRFELEYSLQKGTTANSYQIKAEKTAIIDPPGECFTDNYLEALQGQIDLQEIDYLVLGHFNANRGNTVRSLLDLAPQITVVCSNPTSLELQEFFGGDRELKIIVVRSEDTLDLGSGHQLKLMTAPTPRSPGALLTYDPKTQILFSDKLFCAHVCDDRIFDEDSQIYNDDWRFYYDSIHAAQAKYVLSTLDKIAELPAKFYATGNGPLVREAMTELTELYRKWSEEQNARNLKVALIYTSAYGNTATIAAAIANGLTKAGVAVESINCEVAKPEEIENAIEKCDGFIIGSPTIGGHAPTPIQTALGIILTTASKNKLAGVFGSFGWSGEAIDFLESKLKDAGYTFGFEPIRVKFAPNDVTIQETIETGIDFAQTLKKSQKRRTPKVASGSSSDRTTQAMGRIVGPMCVISAKRGDVSSAMLASCVSPAAFNPPGITVAIAKERALESLTHEGDKFVLNVLADGALSWKHFTKNFAPGEDRFAGLVVDRASNGCYILKEAIAYLECTIANRMECGDHWLVYAVANEGQVLNEGVTAIHYRKSGSSY